MASPPLGTLLIQRLDAALGTTLSQQTQIVNRATSDPVTHPGQPTRPEPVSNTLVRDSRENIDRAKMNAGAKQRVSTPQHPTDTTQTQRNTSLHTTTSASTSLGVAARIILNLFANHTTRSAPLMARAPLLNTAPHANAPASAPGTPATPLAGTTASTPGSIATGTLAMHLAQALTQSLQQSGLFYESHLKGIITGQYRLADIRQEPQSRVVQDRPVAQASAAASGQPVPPPATPGVDPATHQIVRQQLEALADQSLHWRGEAWPGAPMDWFVRRQPTYKHTNESDPDHERSWQSEIKLELPRLGNVTLDVRLSGTRVNVLVQASPNTTTLLRLHTHELRAHMSNRQLELTSVAIIRSDENLRPGSRPDDAQDTSTGAGS